MLHRCVVVGFMSIHRTMITLLLLLLSVELPSRFPAWQLLRLVLTRRGWGLQGPTSWHERRMMGWPRGRWSSAAADWRSGRGRWRLRGVPLATGGRIWRAGPFVDIIEAGLALDAAICIAKIRATISKIHICMLGVQLGTLIEASPYRDLIPVLVEQLRHLGACRQQLFQQR